MKLALLISLLASACSAAQLSFTWSANTETNLAGYRLYYGPQSHAYTNFLQVGRVTGATLQIEGKQFFALSAFNTANQESGLTPELLWNPPATPTNFNFSAVHLITEETCDFVLWEPISTNAISPPFFPLAFYRLRIENFSP